MTNIPIKLLIVPAVFAFALCYLTTTYFLPFYRRHKSRYGQYIPLSSGLASSAAVATSLRERLGTFLIAFVLPAHHERVDDDTSDDEEDLEAGLSEQRQITERPIGFAEAIRDLTAARRLEMARELQEMQDATTSVERAQHTT